MVRVVITDHMHKSEISKPDHMATEDEKQSLQPGGAVQREEEEILSKEADFCLESIPQKLF
jgi:hypothetical protein